VGEKWDEKEVVLYGKPAIFGRMPHGKTKPKSAVSGAKNPK
jgi:hypothetical protein